MKNRLELNLRKAQKLILKQSVSLGPETVSLEKALGRFAFHTSKSPSPIPEFPRSSMDGFAIKAKDIENASHSRPVRLEINGEITAGCTSQGSPLKKGEAVRIMMGGSIPPGADMVLPLEQCLKADDTIIVSQAGRKGAHIQTPGSDLKKHQAIIRAGEPIMPESLSLLAASGINSISVFQQPKAGILCTGSEFADINDCGRDRHVVNSNGILLESLVRQLGAIPIHLGAVPDDLDLMTTVLQCTSESLQTVITTGGTGPGKFDLTMRAFKETGVDLFNTSLAIRPGRTSFFGIKGKTLYFALPGPPPAVRLLFNELVQPAILAAQGKRRPSPPSVRAILTEDIKNHKNKTTCLKGAVIKVKEGMLTARTTKKAEPLNAVMLIPRHRPHLRKGEKVTLHPTSY